MARRGEYKQGRCKQCGGLFLRRPADKEFCKQRCRYRYHNKKRGRVTQAAAREYLAERFITIGEAMKPGAGTYGQIAGRVRRGTLKAERLFGRVLLRKADVLSSISSALEAGRAGAAKV